MDPSLLAYGLIGGVLPALIWLYFWQREDKKRPEPVGLLLRTFFFGAVAVILVLPFQRIVAENIVEIGAITFLLWAVTEEIFKFAAAYFGGLHSPEDNEPIDPLIYMITAALGFVALENTLFLINPQIASNFGEGLITGNLRFIGASLLHVVSSGIVGAALALTFYKGKWHRIGASILGLIAAIVVHALFNIFLMKADSLGAFYVFATVWGAVALLLLFFEKAKKIRRRK
ncbi:MAG: PrsW family glutamic-type intramembrane protease [Parcubacteria group bacterium]